MSNKTVSSLKTKHGLKTPHRLPTKSPDARDLINMTLSLFPTGSAWSFSTEEDFFRILESIDESFDSLLSLSRKTIDCLLPDNDNIDESDLELLEYVYGLDSLGDFNTRQMLVINKLSYYKRLSGRSSIGYLQKMIDLSGYDARIYENKPPYKLPSEIMEGLVQNNNHSPLLLHGTSTQHGYGNFNTIANEVDNESYSIGGRENLWATFFIASRDSIYEPANIPFGEIDNFKKLILKIKPAHLVAFLFI